MFAILKSFLRSMRAKLGRLQFKIFLTRNLPGMYGVLIRSRLMNKHFGSAGENLKIHEGFRFRNIHKVRLGNNVTIGVNSYIQAGGIIEIGHNTILSPNVCLWTHHHNYANSEELIQNQPGRYKNIKIGNDVWIGTGALIEPGSIIGDGAVIKPGSVIDGRTIEPYSVMSGNPAQNIGSRINHNNRIKTNLRNEKISIADSFQAEEFTLS